MKLLFAPGCKMCEWETNKGAITAVECVRVDGAAAGWRASVLQPEEAAALGDGDDDNGSFGHAAGLCLSRCHPSKQTQTCCLCSTRV